MISEYASLTIEDILEKQKELNSIQKDLIFNSHIAKNLSLRLSTSIAQVQKLQRSKISEDLYNSILKLNHQLTRGLEILYEISGQEMILRVWNGYTGYSEIEHYFHEISGTLNELQIENLILVNKGISDIQCKINDIVLNLQNELSKLNSLDGLLDPTICNNLALVLSCRTPEILKAYENYLKYFRLTENALKRTNSKNLQNIQNFSNNSAKAFWNTHFSSKPFALWTQFKNPISTLLDLHKYPPDIRERIILKIRKALDKGFSGIITQSLCDDFFNKFSLDSARIIQELPPLVSNQDCSLTLTVVSCLSNDLIIGTIFDIKPRNYPEGLAVLGRDRKNVNLLVNEKSVSAIHGAISYFPGQGFKYTDLGSSGGSFFMITEPLYLKEGQIIQLASSQVIYIKRCVSSNMREKDEIENEINIIYDDDFPDISRFILNDESKEIPKPKKSSTKSFFKDPFKENKTDKNSKNDLIFNEISFSESEEKEGGDQSLDSNSRYIKSEQSLSEPSLEKNSKAPANGIPIAVQPQTISNLSFSFLEFEFILKGSNQGRVFNFTSSTERITFGRDPASTVPLPDSFISSHHSSIIYTPSGWLYQDNNSSNKSWLSISSLDSLNFRFSSHSHLLQTNQIMKLGNLDLLVEIVN